MSEFVLAIDTSSDRCSVAIGGSGGCIYRFSQSAPREHSEVLHPVIDRALAEVGWCRTDAPRHLDGIAVTTGPGSFTGLRIGIAAAKGLAHAWDLPVAGVPTLEVMATLAARMDEAGLDADGAETRQSTAAHGAKSIKPPANCLVATSLATRSGDCYVGLFWSDSAGAFWRQIGETIVDRPAEALDQVRRLAVQWAGDRGAGPPPLMLCGAPWRAVVELSAETSKQREVLTPPQCDWPDPAVLAAIGAARLAAGLGEAPASIVPKYVRRPSAAGPFMGKQ